jgi:HlyD family secretion protein
MPAMRRVIVVLVLVAAVGAGAWWWRGYRNGVEQPFALYGNVDLRQVELAFNNAERIEQVLVQEGDRVQPGQPLAKLDLGRLNPQVAQAEANRAAQQAVVERLRNGTRPEEIAQARANVDAAQADLRHTRITYDRLKGLWETVGGPAVGRQEFEDARAAFDTAEARLKVNQKALELAEAGPRKEDIAQAEAQLRASAAQLAFLQQQLADATLVAPAAAVVRSRLMEPGEMASPARPVLSLAVTDPKWVRAYVDEPNLGKFKPGMKASVTTDSFGGRSFDGWIGFISPTAEFTPKSVQTEELRTRLVYEVRVFVNDPADELRLGMPATVRLVGGPATRPTTQGSP